MAQLLDMLQAAPTFAALPMETREIYLRLASAYESNDNAIELSPVELIAGTGLGNKQQWQNFLNLQPVQAYISAELSNIAKVAARKNIKALQREALTGDVQAAKLINEMSGLLNTADTNKIFVMHRVDRSVPPPMPQEAP